MYKGNDKTQVPAGERGWVVIRGGSFESRADGDKPITATVRTWVARDTRDTHLGFRLVRAEP
jgi:formylglycine-generating enzyme required for sulfatase activity